MYSGGIAVFADIVDGLFADGNECVPDFFSGFMETFIAKLYFVTGYRPEQIFQCFFHVEGVRMEVVDAVPHAGHGGVQGVAQILEREVQPLILIDDLQRARLQEGAGEQMTYVVMDFPCNPVSLCEGGDMDFVILFC